MSNAKDKRLSIRPYRETIEGVITQFEIIRFALSALTDNEKKKFLQKQKQTKIAHFEAIRKKMSETKVLPEPEIDQWFALVTARVGFKTIQQNRPANRRLLSEFSEDRINQSELLLLVAHFESFLKIIHQTFLEAAPHKVFGSNFRGKTNAEIALNEIFDSKAQCWNSRKFLVELGIKEAKWLDSQRITVKANYFKKHFAVSFGSRKELDELAEIMQRRNEISHEIYEQPIASLDEIVAEKPLVSPNMLEKARRFFLVIPGVCVEKGAKTYQSYFK